MKNFKAVFKQSVGKRYGRAGFFVVAFALAGVAALQLSHASTSTASIEAEAGTPSSKAGQVSDTTASSSNGIKFGVSSGGSTTCNLNATTANFAAQVTAATTGQTICLASGNYGDWGGVNKAITITKQAGATPIISLSMIADSNSPAVGSFTLDGLTIDGAALYGQQSNYASANRPQNIIIRNATFTAPLDISYIANANILIDKSTFNNIDVNSSCTSTPGRVVVSGDGTAQSGVTLSNSYLSGGNSDGVQAGLPMSIINNEFFNIDEKSSNDCAHTDAIQLYGGNNMVIRGNYIHSTADGIVAYDGTSNNLIENNVLDLKIGRFGIELYSDRNSTVRHNTLVYGTGCAFDPCGGIYLDHKSADPAGTNTQIYDNIATTVNVNNGSTASVNTKNMLHSGAGGTNFNGIPVYVGGASANTWAGFKLAGGSPGINAATDGTNVGIN